MPIARQRITPCLWFDDQGEEAAKLYTSIFPNSSITSVARYSEVGKEKHGREPGSVMSLGFTLDGQSFVAINGGPIFQFTEAVSLQIACETQAEVDYYWRRLTDGGAESQCGWLKDRYGLSWQVVPACVPRLTSDPDTSERAMRALFEMKKPDIAALERAASQ
ncbi:3-demethylubiquinone-9 3-methyltransferase [Posidoniimonas polymericola]|uniref:3-demethylubiquinone-9 3-methyltransferase n=1 Tax=Posidoniimonas polymericola TaxID=2528002 RepID=A0A5C5YH57_9BACT|nr:VOC family protein [Posidoniimonas polymericola]TWT74449.1 3-demethylubiquinone-9 3-methyltransferase [Posidoniimonas polymericola]